MFAQYSPLFQAGFKLSSSSPVSSRPSSPLFRTRHSKKSAHESLPVTVKSATFSWYAAQDAQDGSDSGLYLTLEPSRRQDVQGRSFLSLDLADAVSLRRKDTVTSRVSAVAGRKESSRQRTTPTHSPASSTSSAVTIVPRVATPVLRRASGEVIRIPSPKPAPLKALPVVPVPSPSVNKPRRRRPSDITITFSSCFPDIDLSCPMSPTHRATHSAPPVLSTLASPTRSDIATQSYLSFSTVESVVLAPISSSSHKAPGGMRADLRCVPGLTSTPAETTTFDPKSKGASSTRSSVSLSTRQRNRSAALAALEGRSGHRPRAQSIKPTDNFMSMSDDEDEDYVCSTSPVDATSVPFPAVPVSAPARSRAASYHVPPIKRVSRSSKLSAGSASEAWHNRRSTIESLFAPLTNFIDLRACEGEDNALSIRNRRSSRNWRSFVGMAS